MNRWVITAMVLTSLGAVPPASQYDAAGLWGATLDAGPIAHGLASIDGRAKEWQALIAGYAVPVTRDGPRVRWALPDGAGSFDGSLQPDGAITGTWIQPPTVLSGDRYATPVRFQRGATGTWFADVRPLADRTTVYLDVTRASDGSMHAFLRNPEANIGRGRSFLVTVDGALISFVNPDDKTDTISGRIDAKGNTFVAFVDPVGTMTFSRRGRNDAIGFYARTDAGAWSYHQPLPLGDGWRVGTLKGAGVSIRPIAGLIGKIINTPTVSARSPYVQSLLLARHGQLVLDEYFYGFDPWRTHDLRSAGKSFTGLMLGIAIDRGSPIALQETALGAFPQYQSVANEDASKRRITIEDLISMRSGLSCDDNDDNSPGNEDRMYAQAAQPDFYRFALDLPMSAPPGGPKAVYCTAGINLIGGAIRTATRTSLIDFFARCVAQPLQISDYHLNLAPNGDAYAGGGGYLRPRDALKLGQLYLDRGVWNGRRVVSASWIDRSVKQHAAFAASPSAPSHGYGYAWHLFTVTSGGRTYREYMAQGNGGQLIVVLPDLDAVVGFTAGNYNNFPVWRHFFEDDIPNFIIPSLQ
jgi:CubicO group peptidase (beta-lactamase class C family)